MAGDRMEDQQDLMARYAQTKDLAQRQRILTQLLCHMPPEAKDFFLMAFKKERYLDMKLSAVRGYAAYASETEVAALMDKLLELLKKRAAQASCNYTEYEPMRSVFLMPYLLERYGYECFHAFHAQLEKQYAAMPDCFKDVFTLDEAGNAHPVRDPEEVKQSWERFWSEKG